MRQGEVVGDAQAPTREGAATAAACGGSVRVTEPPVPPQRVTFVCIVGASWAFGWRGRLSSCCVVMGFLRVRVAIQRERQHGIVWSAYQ